ncbi:hypothetical protein [Caballeronia sp. J97]|uniref:DUF7079 family protein n=1 Tax=Caballeronia sp. J97 TaxID=2805429 RepID=UPI002AB0262F|nr:hypothetical protein [Caballeronia sp. J97]
MEDLIDGDEREAIWIVMAEFFVDTEVDYDCYAGKLTAYPLPELKRIFFREVAPVCGPNMFTAIPPVWLSFDDDWVVREIRSRLQGEDTGLNKLTSNLTALYYRFRINDVWKKVESAIRRRQEADRSF